MTTMERKGGQAETSSWVGAAAGEREAFEAWFAGQYVGSPWEVKKNLMWAAWQAARAAQPQPAGEPALMRVLELLKEADEERFQNLQKWRAEADRWKAEGDMYGWNFHQGMAAGANWAHFPYFRARRFVEAEVERLSAAPSPAAINDDPAAAERKLYLAGAGQPAARFFVDHGVIHDRKTGKHLHLHDVTSLDETRLREECEVLNAIEAATAHLGGVSDRYLRAIGMDDREALGQPAAREVGDMSLANVIGALKNIGYAVECGACMEVFFTGSTGADHTCRPAAREELLRRAGAYGSGKPHTPVETAFLISDLAAAIRGQPAAEQPVTELRLKNGYERAWLVERDGSEFWTGDEWTRDPAKAARFYLPEPPAGIFALQALDGFGGGTKKHPRYVEHLFDYAAPVVAQQPEREG